MVNFPNNYKVEQGVESTVIPQFYKVHQTFESCQVQDIESEILRSITARNLISRITPNKRIAITASSRQIANMPIILRTLVTIVKEQGAYPFIIPAMGSHGAATADGQITLLNHYGITEESVGAPIISCMDVNEIGRTKDGLPVYCSTTLYSEADAIILCNRIKPHPGLCGNIQSGLVKMSVIGCGKQKGAETCHALGLEHMTDRLIEMSEIVLKKMPVIFGVGIIENEYDQTAEIHCIPSECIALEEPDLLKHSQSLIPKIMPDALDVLIVDEVGKNISGVCADPAVTLRYLVEEKIKQNTRIAPKCFIMCDLTDESDGSASGIGQADIITYRLFGKVDFGKTYVNSMTSTFLPNAKIPIVMRNDYYALKLAIKTCNINSIDKLRIVRIKNTLKVADIYVSKALIPEVQKDPRLRITDGPFELEFDENGNLLPF